MSAVIGIVLLIVCTIFHKADNEKNAIEERDYLTNSRLVNDCFEEFLVSRLQNSELRLEKSSIENKEYFLSIVRLKLAIRYFQYHKREFDSLVEYYKCLQGDSSEEVKTPPAFNKKFQYAVDCINSSYKYINLLNAAKDDDNFNYTFSYNKGLIYGQLYEISPVLGVKEDTRKEYLEVAIHSFQDALKYKNKDIDSQINIEVLTKKSKSNNGGQKSKNQMQAPAKTLKQKSKSTKPGQTQNNSQI